MRIKVTCERHKYCTIHMHCKKVEAARAFARAARSFKKTVQSLLPQQTEALNYAGDSRKATLWHTFGLFSAAISLS